MSAEARARAIVSLCMCIVRLRDCGKNDGGDMTRACMAIKEGAYNRGRRSQSWPGNKPLFVDLLTEVLAQYLAPYAMVSLWSNSWKLDNEEANQTFVVVLQFYLILISK